MKKMTKRIMALMLSLVMILGCVPSFINEASAADYDFTTAFVGTDELKCSGTIEKDNGSIKLDITTQMKEGKFIDGTTVKGLGNIDDLTLAGELASFKLNYEYGISDKKIKVDVTLTLTEDYDSLFEALDAGTHILFTHYHHNYFDDEFYNAITDIDKSKREIKFTLYDYANEEVYIEVIELNRNIEGYTNFTEITNVNDFTDGETVMLFEGKFNKNDLVSEFPSNGAQLDIYKLNNNTNWATIDEKINTKDRLTVTDLDSFEFMCYYNLFEEEFSYLKQIEDIRNNGNSSDYYSYWLDWYNWDKEDCATFEAYLNYYESFYNEYIEETLDEYEDDEFFSSWIKLIRAIRNGSLTELTGISNIVGSPLSDEALINYMSRYYCAAAPMEKVQGLVKVKQKGSKFDTCTEGAIGYEKDHWWYACAYGGAEKDDSGSFYCYTCERINKPYTATAKYVGKHTLNDDEYFEIEKEDIEVTLTIDGKSGKFYDFMLADNLVGKWDNTVSIIIGDGDIINVEVTNYIPTSGGSSKKYKANTKTETGEKISGSGKKGSTRTVYPDEDKKVSDVIVKDKDGNIVEVTKQEDGTYTFKQPASDVTVEIIYDGEKTIEEKMIEALQKDDVKKANSNEGAKINPNAKFVKGYEDGTFKPNKEVSNLELMCMVTQLFEDTASLNAKEEIDLNQGDNEWAGNIAALANGLGLIPGNKNDKNYDLNSNVTRGDLAVVIYNLIKDYTPCDKLVDSDNCKDAVGKDYEEAVAKLVSLGILKGYDDGLFHGDNTLTRAEAVVVINRALISLGFEIKIDSLKVSFPDLSQSHWAYDEIMFAANK